MNSRNRIQKELKEIQKDPDPDIRLELAGDTIEEWKAIIRGPKDSCYEGGQWLLRIKCPPNYPLGAPLVWFRTKIFHPNVHWVRGELCLDVLKEDWSPVWSLQAIMRAVIALLADPNADSPLNCDAGNLLRDGDKRGFESMARMYVAEYANEDLMGKS